MARFFSLAAFFLLSFLATEINMVRSNTLLTGNNWLTNKESKQTDVSHLDQSIDADGNPSRRQKRWQNLFGPSFPYPSAPSFVRNDDLFSSADGYGSPSFIRRAVSSFLSPPAFHPPLFIPVVLVPQVSCGCPQASNNKTKDEEPSDISNRFPDLDDTRQNWGITANGTDRATDDILGPRPISFTPIPPSRPVSRPPPSLDHSSREQPRPPQFRPQIASYPPPLPQQPPPPPQQQPSPPGIPPQSNSGEPEAPSPCDVAIISCCHQKDVRIDCFNNFNCPNVGESNACDPALIREVVQVFQRYYGR